jgi:hypothetical protein
MPIQKDLKRLVRSRMKKTGEAYTTARLHIVNKKKEPEPDYAGLAGMSDAAVRKATGRDWAQWVKALDNAGADQMKHPAIARFLSEAFDTPGWWSQTITVGYERIRGLRQIGQRLSGTWEASRSRTFPVPVTKLFDAFSRPSQRSKWLGGAKFTIRKQTRPKTIRATWGDDGSSVDLYFVAKGEAKSSVAIQHGKLGSKEEVARMKAYWSERLDALREIL